MCSTQVFSVSSPQKGEMYLEFENYKDALETNAVLYFLTLQANFRNVDAASYAFEKLTKVLIKMPAFELAVNKMKSNPEQAAIIKQRYMAPHYNLEVLKEYPKDSLGYTYAAYIIEKGLNPDFYSHIKINSDASYIEARLGQTHDIWHLITGYGTTIIDEIALQAFHIAQFPYPCATVYLANFLLAFTLWNPEMLVQTINAIEEGLRMGKNAKSLFAQRWEDNWEKSISQWRAELNVQPASELSC
ncbi:Coq4 family protein [Dulcicalothrix desertica]|uniref:Coq4 family protein n=2 Tax=Dulcicalothrix desertica TaxID=32056 RepID=UPI00119A9117|nr:Coq4 family protein [Dulcicalothrix desertica]TWH54878.1 ubiquinone biosynthesis protein Coq4 [Dulcicalothrix desertica PCC 7102]